MTDADGSNATRYGVASLSFPCGLRELISQSVTVSSLEQEIKESLPGDMAKQVTLSVWPEKYRTYPSLWRSSNRKVSDHIVVSPTFELGESAYVRLPVETYGRPWYSHVEFGGGDG